MVKKRKVKQYKSSQESFTLYLGGDGKTGNMIGKDMYDMVNWSTGTDSELNEPTIDLADVCSDANVIMPELIEPRKGVFKVEVKITEIKPKICTACKSVIYK